MLAEFYLCLCKSKCVCGEGRSWCQNLPGFEGHVCDKVNNACVNLAVGNIWLSILIQIK